MKMKDKSATIEENRKQWIKAGTVWFSSKLKQPIDYNTTSYLFIYCYWNIFSFILLLDEILMIKRIFRREVN